MTEEGTEIMLDMTVLQKAEGDSRLTPGEGYFDSARFLPPKIRRALDGLVIARANELCYGYEELFAYLTSEQSEWLCRSAVRGIPAIDYDKLP